MNTRNQSILTHLIVDEKSARHIIPLLKRTHPPFSVLSISKDAYDEIYSTLMGRQKHPSGPTYTGIWLCDIYLILKN